MILTIMQPAYLPWLGYFDRIAKSDLFIVLDHVQLDMNSKTKFANRNKIRTPQGWSWLTVPLKTKGKYGKLYINELETTDDQSWQRKHLQSLKGNYAKAPFFKEHLDFFEKLYETPQPHLKALADNIMQYLLGGFEIKTPVQFSSDLKVDGEKDELILNLCRHAGCKTYISGPFGRDYLNKNRFKEEGIELLFHDYRHPEYEQNFDGFEPYMSAIDLLFNKGPESLKILSNSTESLKSS